VRNHCAVWPKWGDYVSNLQQYLPNLTPIGQFEFLRIPMGLRNGPHVRRQSDKYLASTPDGVTIAREIYYRVVCSVDGFCRNFSRIGLRVESDLSADFRKMEKEHYRFVIRLCEIKERLDAVYGGFSP